MAAEKKAGSAVEAAAAVPNGKLFRHLCDRLGKSSKEGRKEGGKQRTGGCEQQEPPQPALPREPSIIDGEL